MVRGYLLRHRQLMLRRGGYRSVVGDAARSDVGLIPLIHDPNPMDESPSYLEKNKKLEKSDPDFKR